MSTEVPETEVKFEASAAKELEAKPAKAKKAVKEKAPEEKKAPKEKKLVAPKKPAAHPPHAEVSKRLLHSISFFVSFCVWEFDLTWPSASTWRRSTAASY